MVSFDTPGALRRLRAAISLFSAVVADDRTEAIKTELRWLAQELGPARDLDTLGLWRAGSVQGFRQVTHRVSAERHVFDQAENAYPVFSSDAWPAL